MDTLSIIIALVSAVAGVLQIILFFKVWQMCNDVKAIRKAQAPEVLSSNKSKTPVDGMFVLSMVIITVIVIFFIVISSL